MTRRPLSLQKLLFTGSVLGATFLACASEGNGIVRIGDDDDTVPPTDSGPADATTPPRPDGGRDAGRDSGSPPNPSRCGNGLVDPGESCDDGNQIDGDGCSSACANESAGPNDLCVGELIELAPVDGTTRFQGGVSGSTATLLNQYQSTCGGGSGADAVYRFVPSAIGRAKVTLTSQFAAIVSARSTCDEEPSELDCSSTGSASEPNVIEFPVLTDQPMFVLVDGAGGDAGEYTLTVEVETAVCGNGLGEHPEACDDGNQVDGDGCSSSCELEDNSAAGACPGIPVRLAATPGAPGRIGFSGDTLVPDTSNSVSTHSGCPVASGYEMVYAITPTVDGQLALDLLAEFEGASLQVHRGCDVDNTVADCRPTSAPLSPARATIAVRAEETVYVMVDSSSTARGGLFTLQAELIAGNCGDGTRGGHEECDDGNQANGDGCSASCTIERDSASFTCPGALVSLVGEGQGHRTGSVWGSTTPIDGAPASTFRLGRCSNSTSSGAGGNSTAPDVVYRVVSDIDGYLTTRLNADFLGLLAALPSCGNPVADASTEELPVCIREATGHAEKVLQIPLQANTPTYIVVEGYVTADTGSTSPYAGSNGPFRLDFDLEPSVCGNGRIDGGENCDDGNVEELDGCSSTCQLEPTPAWAACETAPELPFIEENGVLVARAKSGNTNLTHTKADPSRNVSHTLRCRSVGADAWYAVTAPTNGTIEAIITRANFSSSIGLRSECLPDPSQQYALGCDDETGWGGQRTVAPVAAGETYYVIVDALLLPDRGTFEVEARFMPAGCGDTVLTQDEQCDDGNLTAGDGCSSTCELEAIASVDTCPGATLELQGQGSQVRTATRTLDLNTLSANVAGSCGGSGKDGVFRIRPDVGGTLTVRSQTRGASGRPVLYLREDCIDPSSQLACSAVAAPVVTAPVVANQDYFLFVDSFANQSGIVELDVSVIP